MGCFDQLIIPWMRPETLDVNDAETGEHLAENFALEVGNDDRVAVGRNDDLLEGVSACDIVGDCTQRECAVAA